MPGLNPHGKLSGTCAVPRFLPITSCLDPKVSLKLGKFISYANIVCCFLCNEVGPTGGAPSSIVFFVGRLGHLLVDGVEHPQIAHRCNIDLVGRIGKAVTEALRCVYVDSCQVSQQVAAMAFSFDFTLADVLAARGKERATNLGAGLQ